MQLETSTWMMIAFIIVLILNIWKIYSMVPNKVLADDDTTDKAQEELLSIVLKTIKVHNGNITTVDELYTKILINEDFNKEKFWRFNTNKLKKILDLFYINNQNINNLDEIYNSL